MRDVLTNHACSAEYIRARKKPISYRSSRKADQILVLRHGQIIECGTPEELVASGGLCSRLARIQSATAIEESFEESVDN